MSSADIHVHMQLFWAAPAEPASISVTFATYLVRHKIWYHSEGYCLTNATTNIKRSLL